MIAEINYDSKYILKALTEIVSSNEEIYSNFGNIAYLKEAGGSYFLQYDIDQPQEALSLYTHQLSVNDHTSLAKFIAPLQEIENIESQDSVLVLDLEDLGLNDKIIATKEEVKAKLLEDTILAYIYDAQTPIQEHLLSLFQNRLYEVAYDPLTMIKRPSDDTIYFHDILTRVSDRAKYTATTKSNKNAGKIRILKNDVWVFATSIEAPIYYELLRNIDNERTAIRFGDKLIYGIVSTSDGLFRIIDKSNYVAGTDIRKIPRGQVCCEFTKKDLIYVLYTLNINPPTMELIPPSSSSSLVSPKASSRVSMVNMLSAGPYKRTDFSTFNDEEVVYMFEWNKYKREQMCSFIKDKLTQMKLIAFN